MYISEQINEVPYGPITYQYYHGSILEKLEVIKSCNHSHHVSHRIKCGDYNYMMVPYEGGEDAIYSVCIIDVNGEDLKIIDLNSYIEGMWQTYFVVETQVLISLCSGPRDKAKGKSMLTIYGTIEP